MITPERGFELSTPRLALTKSWRRRGVGNSIIMPPMAAIMNDAGRVVRWDIAKLAFRGCREAISGPYRAVSVFGRVEPAKRAWRCSTSTRGRFSAYREGPPLSGLRVRSSSFWRSCSILRPCVYVSIAFLTFGSAFIARLIASSTVRSL